MINKDNLMLFNKLDADKFDSQQKYSIALVSGKEIQLVTNYKKSSLGTSTVPYVLNDKDRLLNVMWGTIERSDQSCHGSCLLRIDNPARLLFRFKHEYELFTLKNLRSYINQLITEKLKYGESMETLKEALNESLMESGLSIQMLEIEENDYVQ